MKPKILLLDEPLSALDGVIKESIKEKIKEIARDFHLTTIIVTHDPEEALTLSDMCHRKPGISVHECWKRSLQLLPITLLRNLSQSAEIKRNNIFTPVSSGPDQKRTGGIRK